MLDLFEKILRRCCAVFERRILVCQSRCFLAQLRGKHFRELRLSYKISDAGLGSDHGRRPGCRGHRPLFERISESQHPLAIASSMSMRLRCPGWAIPVNATGW